MDTTTATATNSNNQTSLISYIPPTLSARFSDFEYSLHSLPRTLVRDLPTIFPDLQTHPKPYTALLVPTIQLAKLDLLEFGHAQDEEKDRLLIRFLDWAGKVRRGIIERGGWCDVTDPVTGCAHFGPCGGAYSDVEGMVKVLGYATRDAGGCRVLRHPRWGFAIYPASMFTTASVEVVREALVAVNEGSVVASMGEG